MCNYVLKQIQLQLMIDRMFLLSKPLNEVSELTSEYPSSLLTTYFVNSEIIKE